MQVCLSVAGRLSSPMVRFVGVLACPYQEDAPVCGNKQFKFYSDRGRLDLHEILSRGRPACLPYNFDARFADSTIKRSGLDRLKRNAQICLANITNPTWHSEHSEKSGL